MQQFTKILLGTFVLLACMSLANAVDPVCEEGSCPSPSICVSDGVCSCYGNQMKMIIVSDVAAGTYVQKCENLRVTGWRGFFIASAVLISALALFYFGGNAMMEANNRSVHKMYKSQEYIAAKKTIKNWLIWRKFNNSTEKKRI